MSEVKLGYTSDSCRSAPGDRIGGERQRRWLLNNDFPTNPVARFLKRSVEMLPCSISTYMEMGKLPVEAFTSEYLRPSFPNGAHPLLPNAWIDDVEAVMAFHTLKGKWNISVDQATPGCPYRGQTLRGFLAQATALGTPPLCLVFARPLL